MATYRNAVETMRSDYQLQLDLASKEGDSEKVQSIFHNFFNKLDHDFHLNKLLEDARRATPDHVIDKFLGRIRLEVSSIHQQALQKASEVARCRWAATNQNVIHNTHFEEPKTSKEEIFYHPEPQNFIKHEEEKKEVQNFDLKQREELIQQAREASLILQKQIEARKAAIAASESKLKELELKVVSKKNTPIPIQQVASQVEQMAQKKKAEQEFIALVTHNICEQAKNGIFKTAEGRSLIIYEDIKQQLIYSVSSPVVFQQQMKLWEQFSVKDMGTATAICQSLPNITPDYFTNKKTDLLKFIQNLVSIKPGVPNSNFHEALDFLDENSLDHHKDEWKKLGVEDQSVAKLLCEEVHKNLIAEIAKNIADDIWHKLTHGGLSFQTNAGANIKKITRDQRAEFWLLVHPDQFRYGKTTYFYQKEYAIERGDEEIVKAIAILVYKLDKDSLT
jgi:hypothetical protein